ncbi:hypothetical protein TVAG_587410 [Trichomonas vaginalis G3]|uniref:Uncharacterized protein n=1 Tax=Trichomonas vaginalis (strain ATCC PRA-98 / G3) TaxID=412133 RepID=A2G2V8_TRIV3|nr:hypothetical protein TVAGG3_0820110 [Trichomonas vaginalis G3]EAX88500.1 hypothetical protein TVAG_587410 [Trichomonas vaginalis G3]KAI5497819.1 hypothetical protein TVAGG3_0820110 [Trichomonas vaginalis G3]|eukprot:XP_001301430.1 hypothetical protein [Trichomonas vaginalis G3]
MAPYIPKIVELSSQHFFQRTIRDFQVLVAQLMKQVTDFGENLPPSVDNRAPLNRISSALQNLMQKSLLISYLKAPPSTFNSIQQTIRSIQQDFLSMRDTAISSSQKSFNSLLSTSNELENSIKHIIAAHGFLSITTVLQNLLRHFAFDEDIKIPSLKNEHCKLNPKPSKESPNSKTASQVLNEYKEIKNPDPETRQRFITEFETSLESEIKFESCTSAIESIIFVILTIQPPQDPAKKVFTKCSNFYFSASRAVTQFYKLPEYAFSKNDIEQFNKALENLQTVSDSIIKARKKPVGWSAQDTKSFMKCTEPLIKIGQTLTSVIDVIEKGNQLIGTNIFKLNLSQLLPRPISLRFLVSEPLDDENQTEFNINRCLSKITPQLQSITEKGLSMLPTENKIIHPADFTTIFSRIRVNIRLIEEELFNLSLNRFNDFPVAKAGITMLSSISGIRERLEQYILCMNTIPLVISSLREISMILYEQGFSVNMDHVFTEINSLLNIIFDVYRIYEEMDISGAANLSTCSQLSFIATSITELTQKWPEFQPFSEYFSNLNLFKLNMTEILSKIEEFRNLSTDCLKRWTSADYVSRFNAQYKSIYSSATIIRREQIEALPSKLLGQLTGWLSNLPHSPPKRTTVNEMDIKMSILRKMLTIYINTHPDNQISSQFEQLFNCIDMFAQMNIHFYSKLQLKNLLSFLERVNTGSDNPTESSDVDNTDTSSAEPSKNDESNIDSSQLVFSEEEMALWTPFAQKVFSVDHVSVHPQFPSYTEEFVHSRARQVYEEFKEEWRGETSSFDTELAEIDSEISQPSYEHLTLHYQSFNDKVVSALEHKVDLLLQMLLELNPPSRGRGYPREFPPHPKAAQISELSKILTSVGSNLKDLEFGWLPTLLECRGLTYNIFRATDVSSDQTTPVALIRNLTNCAFAFFRLSRCLLFAKGTTPTFAPDLKMLKVLVGGLLEKTRFVKENSPLLFHEIDQVVKSNMYNNFSSLISSVKVLKRSRALFDAKELVTITDLDFFDFGDFFKRMNCEHISLSSFLDSNIYEIFTQNICPVTKYVESNFDNSFLSDHIKSILKFKQELSISPIAVSWDKTDDRLTSLTVLQQLIDISISFDRVCPVVQRKRKEPFLSGTDFLSIELLIFELQNEIESLVQSKPSRLCKLYIDLTRVLTAMKDISSKFGPRKSNSSSMTNFVTEWNNFTKSLDNLPMSDFHGEFRHLSNKIIDVIQDSPSLGIQREIKSITFLLKHFEILPTIETLRKLRFAFQFLEGQKGRFTTQDTTNTLPFFQLQVIISTMLSMYRIVELIPMITIKLSKSIGQELPIRKPDILEVIDNEEKPSAPSNSDLERQLTLFEQTALGHMTSALFDANVADEEKIATLPILKRSVEHCKMMVENAKLCNQELESINNSLKEYVQIKSVPNENKQETEGGESAEGREISTELDEVRSKKEYDIIKNRYQTTMSSVLTLTSANYELSQTKRQTDARNEKNQNLSHLISIHKELESIHQSGVEWNSIEKLLTD